MDISKRGVHFKNISIMEKIVTLSKQEIELIKETLKTELDWVEHELFNKYFCPTHMTDEAKTIDKENEGYGLNKRHETLKRLIEIL